MAESPAPTVNRLGDETSPYLLQHKDNPVHWCAWDEAALAEAREKDKPILLSVGYAACHWCHVMAHECFENEEIAALMNALFVNIKVDREERPDLDGIYQHALALLGQQGGWPLTMFLTPAGEPFWGGTYFPPAPRYGRPGFPQVLQGVAGAYHKEPEKVRQNVAGLGEALQALSENRPGEEITLAVTGQVAQQLADKFDPHEGGLQGAPKFPQPAILKLLWRAWKRDRAENCRRAVELTLERMCQGGIYDHLGGGFARYSVDERWLAPHFEKMLYDNAQMIQCLTWVWAETGNPLFETRLRETVDWTLREMIADADGTGKTPSGAFAATLDADSEGEEGKFYVWQEAEIDALLGADSAFFKEAYEVTPQGNWEGKTILNRSRGAGLLDAAGEMKLAVLRKVLFEVRAKRVWPGWDDKVLADWNGLMITALAEAAMALDEPDWLAAAERAFAVVLEKMTEAGRLKHVWRRGTLKHPAGLDDYANLAEAALALHEATGKAGYLARAEAWVEELEQHFWDPEAGGYFLTAADAKDLIVRPKNAHDNATPSGNGTMLGVLARLYYLTGKTWYLEKADSQVKAFAGETERNVFPLGTLLSNNELLQRAQQIVVIGDRDEPGCQALLRAVYGACLPNRVLQVLSDSDALPAGHPARSKKRKDGKATAYLCLGQSCSLPVTEPETLSAMLNQ